jgi:arginyl-tRNA synthetase
MISEIKELLIAALQRRQLPVPPNIIIERTRQENFGHFSTNLALNIAKSLKRAPLELAAEIVGALPSNEIILKAEVAAPGFINFHLHPRAFQQIVPEILAKGQAFGRTELGQGQKVQVEFVSANPTGPLTVGHGRQAVLGDTIARLLEWNGYQVVREYYYNDAGRQMRILGHSVYYRYRELLGYQEEFPEDHYQGEYIRDIAREIFAKYGRQFENDPDHPIFKESAEEAIFADIRRTLQRLGIVFDTYYNEKSLYEDGHVETVLQRLKELGVSYEKDGAIWFKAGEFGGTGDRVLWKSVVDEATYRLPDIAYHTTKFERGFDLVIDIFGADHHATYPDVLAGLKALGYDTSRIKVLLHQFVTLTRAGEKVKMSTRRANYVTLDELIDEVGTDVVRYFFIMRGAKSHLNFDLDLAKTEGEENPVYYLQYAHARIASILRKADHLQISLTAAPDVTLLSEPAALALLNNLTEFPEVINVCWQALEPQPLTTYLTKLATAFHKFYTEHRVISDDLALTQARLALVRATQTVLANGLKILGVSAPERM